MAETMKDKFKEVLKKEANDNHWIHPDADGCANWDMTNDIIDDVSQSCSDLCDQFAKQRAIDFAHWYHNGLTNAERYIRSVEEYYDMFISKHIYIDEK